MSEPVVTATTIERDFVQQGFSLPDEVEELGFPSDISNVPNTGPDNIGDLMGRLASYISFLEYKVSLAEIDYENWNNHYELEKKKALLVLPSARKDLMEAQAETQLETMIDIVARKKALFDLLKSLLSGKRRLSDALSRDLTRRSLVHQMSMRGI